MKLRNTCVVSHPKSLNLPKEFDARTAWSQCSTIGRILGGSAYVFLLLIMTMTWIAESIFSLKIRVTVVLVGHLVLLNHYQDEYESRILERDSQEALGGDDMSSEQSDNNIFLEVVGGVDKKKRIFGLGLEGQNQFSSSTQSARISVSEYMQIKTECMQIKADNQSLREQMSGLHANQEKLVKFMEAFSQSHPRPPSPPPSPNEEGQQDDNEYFDELDG